MQQGGSIALGGALHELHNALDGLAQLHELSTSESTIRVGASPRFGRQSRYREKLRMDVVAGTSSRMCTQQDRVLKRRPCFSMPRISCSILTGGEVRQLKVR